LKILILGGTGDMGRRTAIDLAARSEVSELTVSSTDLAKAQRLAKDLGAKVKAVQVDADQPETLIQAMRGKDIVANAIGPFYKYEKIIVKSALKAKVNYVSICDDFDAVKSILPLDPQAEELGLSILTGMGWTPGISNILARKGADVLDDVDEINIYWAGSSQDAIGFAVVLHTIHIFTGMVDSFIDGEKVLLPAGSEKEKVEFLPPLGSVDMYHLGHPEPVTLPRFIPGVKTVTLKGGLSEGFLNTVAIAAARLGLTSTPAKKHTVGKIMKKLLPIFEKFSKSAVPLSGIRVDIKGRLNGKAEHIIYQAADHMDNLTGVPLAIGALMLGKGEITRKGVFAPEAVVDPDAFIEALAERNIKIVCTKAPNDQKK